jgi:hypothetical protein
MCSREGLLVFTLFFFCPTFVRAYDKGDNVEKPVQEVRSIQKEKEVLRAYERPNRVDAEAAGRWIGVVLFGVVGMVIIMFLFIAYFYEPTDTKLRQPTVVKRAEGFTPYRREREQSKERYDVSND